MADRSDPGEFGPRSPGSVAPGAHTAFSHLLLLSVYGFALSLLLGRGTYEIALYLCPFAVAGMLSSMPGLPTASRDQWLFLVFGMIFLIQGIVTAQRPLAGGFHVALAWSLLMGIAVGWVPDRFGGPLRLDHRKCSMVFLLLFVLTQILAYRWKLNKAGLFSNIHYLALYSVITLPLLCHFVLTSGTKLRWMFALTLIGDFWLLLQTQSRPGFLALLLAAMVVLPFLSKTSRFLATTAIVAVPSLLYLTGWFGFTARIDDLFANFVREERPVIWRETLDLLAGNSVAQWWFGHGLGQFFWDYQVNSSFHYKEDYSSPHNFLLDLLYSHGIFGLVLFLAGFALYYGKLAAVTLASGRGAGKLLGIVLISITTADLAHGFLTLPFFSRHHLFPLSLILGAGLRYCRDNPRNV